MLEPLFEFSGACAGCGETPYVKLMSQLFGDRMMIANATGCSSIYGGNLPTTPYSRGRRGTRADLVQLAVRGQRRIRLGLPPGRRPEAGLRRVPAQAARRLRRRRPGHATCSSRLSRTSWNWPPSANACSGWLPSARSSARPKSLRLAGVADGLVTRSVWILGGDGWAYDIGFGGLGPRADHRPRRQHPGARHRRLLQHGWPGLQGHAARRGGQVRRLRQAVPQEGPGHDRRGLRQRLRRSDRRRGPTRCRRSRRSARRNRITASR